MATGMTEEEIAEVQVLTKLVMEFDTKQMDNFKIHWWKSNPHAQEFFTKFKGKNEAEMREMSIMTADGSRFFGTLYMLVKNLQYEDVLKDLLLYMKENHSKRNKNVTREIFDSFIESFLQYLKSSLGQKMTPVADSGFRNLLNHIGKEAGLYH